MMSHTRTSVANAFVLCPKSHRSPSAENRDRMAMSGHTAVMIHEPKTTNTSTAATITMSKAQNLRKRRSIWRRFRSLFLLVVMMLFILYYKLTSGRVDEWTSKQVEDWLSGYLLFLVRHKVVDVKYAKLKSFDNKARGVYAQSAIAVWKELLYQFVLPLLQALHAKRHSLEV